MKRRVALLGILGGCYALWRKQATWPALLTGRAMGCEWRFLTDGGVPVEDLRAGIAEVIEHWEQVLSTWRPDSDLCRHNRGGTASADLSRVLQLAEQLRSDTAGSFDHRMLSQLTAAGFGPGGKGIDLSSLGKGFAVDRVVESLRNKGIRRFVFSLAVAGNAIRPQNWQHFAFEFHRLVAGGDFDGNRSRGQRIGGKGQQQERPKDVLVIPPGKPTTPPAPCRKMCW